MHMHMHYAIALADPATQSVFLAWLLAQVGPYVGPALLGLVFLVLGGILHLLYVAIAHLKAGTVRHYLLAIADGARQVVDNVEQTLRPQYPADLSVEDAKKLRDAAVKALLEQLSSFGLAGVKASLKLTDEQLAARLGVAIEAAVAGSSSTTAPSATPPVPGPTEATGPAEKETRTAPSGRPVVGVAGKGG